MIRRFVNVVAENEKTGVYTLHRLDVLKHLFHRSRADARAVPPLPAGAHDKMSGDEQPTVTVLDWLKELPAPCVKIQPSYREVRELDRLPFWALLSPRRSEDEFLFLCINPMDDAMLCDARKPSVDPMPHLRGQMGLHPISLSVVRPDHAQGQDQEQEEDLYVFHDAPELGTSCFRVFRRDAGDGWRWRWESLPPPPFVGRRWCGESLSLRSYTVVDGGRTICFSCAPPVGIGTCAPQPGTGTYCFDAVEREWRHAGDWLLPFEGRAEYVPDLALWLWLGFPPCSPYDYLSGTSDLNAMAMDMDHPPKSQYLWQDLVTPGNWSAGWSQLVSLGSCRFCIAKAFVIENRRTGKNVSGFEEEWYELVDEVTVLTGIKVGRGDDGRLEVWKHKSMEYSSRYTVCRAPLCRCISFLDR